MKQLKNQFPLNNVVLVVFGLFQAVIVYFGKTEFINYYFLMTTLLAVMSARNKTIAVFIQAIFIIINPVVAVKAILLSILYLWTISKKQIKIRFSTISLTVFFIFLVYFEHNQVAALFPGLVALSAIMYYTSRIRASLSNLTAILPAYLITIALYTFTFIIFSPVNAIKPVFALPIDIIQILFAVLLYSIFEGIAANQTQKTV